MLGTGSRCQVVCGHAPPVASKVQHILPWLVGAVWCEPRLNAEGGCWMLIAPGMVMVRCAAQ